MNEYSHLLVRTYLIYICMPTHNIIICMFQPSLLALHPPFIFPVRFSLNLFILQALHRSPSIYPCFNPYVSLLTDLHSALCCFNIYSLSPFPSPSMAILLRLLIFCSLKSPVCLRKIYSLFTLIQIVLQESHTRVEASVGPAASSWPC